jgi:hypothetical protein
VAFISFDIPGDAPHRIQPTSSLPPITILRLWFNTSKGLARLAVQAY